MALVAGVKEKSNDIAIFAYCSTKINRNKRIYMRTVVPMSMPFSNQYLLILRHTLLNL